MAYKLVITVKAENDLDEILAYIVMELCNAPAAAKLTEAIEERYALLAENPYLYSECQQPLLKPFHFRKIVIGNYLMIYRADDEQGVVFVERFFSEMQDYANKL